MNDLDQIINEEPRLLIKSLDLSIKEVIASIHQLGGIAVLAHAMSDRFSINGSLDFDAIEVTKEDQKDYLQEQYPFLKETIFFMNSDAHRLDMISEPIHQISKDEFYGLWRKRYG